MFTSYCTCCIETDAKFFHGVEGFLAQVFGKYLYSVQNCTIPLLAFFYGKLYCLVFGLRHTPIVMTSTWCGRERTWSRTFYEVYKSSKKSTTFLGNFSIQSSMLVCFISSYIVIAVNSGLTKSQERTDCLRTFSAFSRRKASSISTSFHQVTSFPENSKTSAVWLKKSVRVYITKITS